ncbi:uncharacterized protein LOC129941961 [Eupeodes corollae]|uniref:uncharacterized protein LOC129941961 n=1 Tax=Eupeodes corollae TaxID=290404 RepID=UPI002491F3E9|nr:uncharacterized protein LOC129941961 [Eupeodes corollae]
MISPLYSGNGNAKSQSSKSSSGGQLWLLMETFLLQTLGFPECDSRLGGTPLYYLPGFSNRSLSWFALEIYNRTAPFFFGRHHLHHRQQNCKSSLWWAFCVVKVIWYSGCKGFAWFRSVSVIRWMNVKVCTYKFVSSPSTMHHRKMVI